MFTRIPARIKKEYRFFLAEQAPLVVLTVLVTLCAIVTPVFQLLYGVGVFQSVYGLFFREIDVPDGIGHRVAVFIMLIALSFVFDYLSDRCRESLAFRADDYADRRLSALDIPERGEAFSGELDRIKSCKKCFADVLDGAIANTKLVFLMAGLGVFAVWANPVAGLPFIACDMASHIVRMKRKESGRLHFLSTLSAELYILSSVALILLRLRPFGALLGFYGALMLRRYFSEAYTPQCQLYIMNVERVNGMSTLLTSADSYSAESAEAVGR